MKETNNIVWLASYPKSGNTWFRVFLSNLFQNNSRPAHINELKETGIASARNIFDEVTGLPSEDLTHEEIDELRPEVYQWIAEEAEEFVFKKVHDAYTYLPDGRPLFPPEASHSVIYFLREPLDVAVSFAHHSAKKPVEMIKALNNPDFSFCGKRNRFYNQLRQKLGTWSQHVKSWVDQDNIPVHVMRYEDMKKDSFQTFKSAVRFLGLDKSDEEIKNAIELSDLSVLQEQEKEEGFREKSIRAESFFRKGSIGEGKQMFSKQEINQIIDNHMDILQRFGYLSDIDGRF
jgi:hypothetical protein